LSRPTIKSHQEGVTNHSNTKGTRTNGSRTVESGSDIKVGKDKYGESEKLKQLLGKITEIPAPERSSSSEAFIYRVIQSVRNYNYLVHGCILYLRSARSTNSVPYCACVAAFAGSVSSCRCHPISKHEKLVHFRRIDPWMPAPCAHLGSSLASGLNELQLYPVLRGRLVAVALENLTLWALNSGSGLLIGVVV